MADEFDPNAALFGGDEPEISEEEAHMKETFGKNPNRTSAFSELFLKDMLDTVEAEEELPEEAKKQLIFKMTANSVLDVIVESLAPETAEEVTSCLAIDTDGDFVADSEEAVFDGAFHESYFQSAPYFTLQIDGIEWLNDAY